MLAGRAGFGVCFLGDQALPAAGAGVGGIVRFAPQRDAGREELPGLGSVADADVHAVVPVGAHGGVEDHRHALGLEAEAGGLPRRRHEIEHGHQLRDGLFHG